MPAQRERNPHSINLDDMLVFIETGALAWQTYASDGGKRLEFRHAGGYRVTLQGVVTYQGTDGRSAVKIYNDA